jgi:redox-sensitive bicupin YhaK (pirin superfamily)
MTLKSAARTVQSIVQPPRQRHGPGLATTDLSEAQLGPAMDPFIVVSLYDMAGPTFPPHPHAGFSVATYILPESAIGFINHDTLGNRNRIAPGALHVTVAGSGVQHEEQPERTGSLARGFQIWIDHADTAREIAPYALHLRATEVPIVRSDGAAIRVVMGASNGMTSPISPPTPVRVIDVALESGAYFHQELAEGENAFLLVHAGVAEIAGARVQAGAVAVLSSEGERLSVSAPEENARFTLFAGSPLRQHRVQRGPFVAKDADQLQRFVNNFQRSGFGVLTPFAAQPDWKPNDGQELPP